MIPETQSAPGQRFNALKHGGYAASILLPGEDPVAFHRERRSLFHNYRPQTQDEADLVDALAEHRWLRLRFRAIQARFDGQAVAPEQDAAGRVAEPLAHQRLHSGMDVTVQRHRVDKLWNQARSKLLEVQKLRRQGLVAGAMALPKDCYMETDGRVYGPVAPKAIVPIPEPEIEAAPSDRDPPPDGSGLPASTNGENGKYSEQKESGREAVRHTGSRGRSTGGFGAPGVSTEAPKTVAAGG